MKNTDLTAENAALKNRIMELETLVKYYEGQFRLSKHRQFGASSEKSEYDLSQLSIFNEAELTADVTVPEPELVKIANHYRKRKRLVNDRLPDNLPVEIIEHGLPVDEQICLSCDGNYMLLGKKSAASLKLSRLK